MIRINYLILITISPIIIFFSLALSANGCNESEFLIGENELIEYKQIQKRFHEKYKNYDLYFQKIQNSHNSNLLTSKDLDIEKYGSYLMNELIESDRDDILSEIRLLTMAGINPDERRPGINAPIISAVIYKRADVIKFFAEQGFINNDCVMTNMLEFNKNPHDESLDRLITTRHNKEL